MPTARRRSWTLLLRLLPAAAFAIVAATGSAAAEARAFELGAADARAMWSHSPAGGPGAKRSARRVGRKVAPRLPAVGGEDDDGAGPAGRWLGASPRGEDVEEVRTVTIVDDDAARIGLDPRRSPATGGRVPPPSSDRAVTVDGRRLERPPQWVRSA